MRRGVLLGAVLAVFGTAGAAAPAHAAYDDPPTVTGVYVTSQYAAIDARMPNEHTCHEYSQSGYGSRPFAEVAITNPIQPPRERVENDDCWSGDSFTIYVNHGDRWGGTTYYYRLGGSWTSRYSPTGSYVTPTDVPYAETGWVSEVDDAGVTFRGAIADGGLATTWRVGYRKAGESTYRYTPTRTLPGDGGPPEEVVERLDSGLQPGTSYEFRFEATNGNGPTQGPVATFATSSRAPEVRLIGAVNVTDTYAELRATVDPNGAPTDYWWDIEPSWGFPPSGPWGAGSSWDPVPITLRYSGLAPDTEYSFTVLAENDLGPAATPAPITFRTLPEGAAPPPPPADDPPSGATSTPAGDPAVTTLTRSAQTATPTAAARTVAQQTARTLTSTPLRALLRPSGVVVRALPVPSAGRLAVTLRPQGGRTVLARTVRTARRAGRTDVRLRATKAGRAWLRARRKAALTLSVTFRPQGGKPVTQTRRVTLRR